MLLPPPLPHTRCSTHNGHIISSTCLSVLTALFQLIQKMLGPPPVGHLSHHHCHNFSPLLGAVERRRCATNVRKQFNMKGGINGGNCVSVRALPSGHILQSIHGNVHTQPDEDLLFARCCVDSSGVSRFYFTVYKAPTYIMPSPIVAKTRGSFKNQ